MMFVKSISLLLLLLAVVQGRGVQKVYSEAEGKAFENKILELLEDLRNLLKNGDPEQGIPPMEPLPFGDFGFDFIIDKTTRLAGDLNSVLIYNISDFVVTNVKFDVLKVQIQLGLNFQVLIIDGGYDLKGLLFDTVVDGRGSFLSNTTDLQVDVLLHLGSNFDHSHIKELNVYFTLGTDDIVISNEVTGEDMVHFDDEYLHPILYRIRDEYFPLILNTLTLVGSDVIYDLTLDQILSFIINDILGGGLRFFEKIQ